jgi:hypothetical protein
VNNKYAFAAAINLLTLVIGLGIGFMFGTARTEKVFAQVVPPPTQKIEEVSPGLSTGTIAVGLVLSHVAETDTLIANGYDVMKMQEGILNYLGSRPNAERADIQNIVTRSKAETFYKIKEEKPAAPSPTPSPKTDKEKKQ